MKALFLLEYSHYHDISLRVIKIIKQKQVSTSVLKRQSSRNVFSYKPVKSTAQKKMFSIKDFSSKCDQIHRKLPKFFTSAVEILNGKLQFFVQ